MTKPEPSPNSKRSFSRSALNDRLAARDAEIVGWLRRSAAEQLGIAAQKTLGGLDSRDDATAAHVMMMLSYAVEQKRYVLPDA